LSPDALRCKILTVVNNGIGKATFMADCISNGVIRWGSSVQRKKMTILRSHRHDIYTEEVNKVALSADDDKRIIMENGISTLAHGHYNAHLYQTAIARTDPEE